MRRAALILLCAVIGVRGAWAQERLVPDSLFAPALQTVKRFLLLLPEGYDGTRNYPLLVLLHGLWGDYTDWTRLTRIEDYSARHPFLIVMPDAGDSWYVNAVGDARERYEDYLSRDLQSYVRAHYPVDTLHVGIAGLSMGGYGSMVQAFRHPREYFFAGSLSGAFTIPKYIDRGDRSISDPKQMQNLRRIFGDRTHGTRKEYDVLELSAKANPDSLPYLYVAVGNQDELPGLLRMNRVFMEKLSERHIRYEYHETPAGHSWEYWDRAVVDLLDRFAEVIRDGYIPITRPLGETIRRKGPEAGEELFRRLRKDPRYEVREGDFTALGRSLLAGGNRAGGIGVLTLATETFPTSWKAFEQLGAGSLAAADTLRATAAYLRALELNPGNADLQKTLNRLKPH